MQDVAGFFVKHVKTGKCIYDTARIQSQDSDWGSVSFLELSNNCLDPAAQFRFRDNGAMLNLKRRGCLAIYKKYRIDEMFYVYVPNTPGAIEVSACADHRVIKQTSWGGLSGLLHSAARCADPDRYLKTNASCVDGENKRFIFGSVTCYGKTTENVACSKDQFMVVKTASYRGLSDSKTCGLSDDYSCTVDVTCLVKKQCDGQHECKITVDETLFSDDLCPGLKKYLYFEYQCIDTSTSFTKPCVESVSLTSSTSPNKGFLTVTINNKNEIVCSKALKSQAKDIVCRQLGYWKRLKETSTVSGKRKEDVFQGSIDCNGGEATLSQCQTTRSSANDCKELSYVTCAVCENPLLEYKDYFPDSFFTASDSLSGHNPAKARISSGSSWCAPVANGKHYLQVDLGRSYVVYYVATFGDRTNSKWVTSYHLNYSVDMIQWKQASNQTEKIFRGNRNANNHVVRQSVDDNIELKALRFIPLDSVVQPCMRVQICGKSIKPGRPFNLTVNKITSRSAEVSWLDPVVSSKNPVTRFWIILKHGGARVINKVIIFRGENKFSMKDLTPFTNYEVSVALANSKAYGDRVKIAFRTGEEAPDGPPLNVKVISESSSSLSVTWDPPEEEKRNGVIISYTVCVLQSRNEPCLQTFTMGARKWVISNLNPLTKYYVRVLAITSVGQGSYSKSKEAFTNGKQPEVTTTRTSRTLTFTLQIPPGNFSYFYVVALKLKDEGQELSSTGSYDNNELVTYAEARRSPGHKPYIAAVFSSSSVVENKFILGDGRKRSDATLGSSTTSSNYYNGPLEPGTSYRIFQRIILDKKDDVYSTDWSLALKTNEYAGTPRVLTNMSSSDEIAKEGDLVNLLCSAQGEPPITFSWEKDQTSLEAFMEKDTPHRSSLLVASMKDQSSFGKYICHIKDRFQSTTTYTISVEKLKETGNYVAGIIVLSILLFISLLIIAFLIYRYRTKSLNSETIVENKPTNDKNDIDDGNYEQINEEQAAAIYTSLKWTGKKENDDAQYTHLNEVPMSTINVKN
ncbi:uncharacterized protein LOC114525264 [Dendronephthya gigantea]|uniref:uncharacterized protein LOC114525264 n=1 Tax=Dendronephthya gigantea TaxID=151771 RepID=UPI00106B7B06|nr:uncharacterized protein LOC114525264 [Dendronephthya gigantea]